MIGEDSTHVTGLDTVLVLLDGTKSTREDKAISAREITHFVHRNVVPRDDSSRDWSDQKAVREWAIEHDSHVVTPLHSRINLAPIIWTTTSIYEFMCRTIDGRRVLDTDRTITLHDSNVVPL